MEKYHGKTVEYWKHNAEENYLTTPISVLKYITVLEEQAEQCAIHDVMCSCNYKCDGCGKMYYEPNIKMEFGEFNICDDCKNNPNIEFE